MLNAVPPSWRLGGANDQTIRMKHDGDRLWAPAPFTEYGTANDPGESNTQPVTWSLRSWSHGSAGVLPWQVIGTAESWRKADATCLFYPTDKGPLPSVCLKAFTRAQQDIEYLERLAVCCGQPRAAAMLDARKPPRTHRARAVRV